MDESGEELEPLFDYSRVQPVTFIPIDDDLSDSEKTPKLSPKRLKTSDPVSCESVIVVDCDGEEEEEEWLRPPPKGSNVAAQKVEQENSTIKELRLKKQELEQFAKSAEDLLRTVEESTRKQLTSSVPSTLESEAEKTSKPHDERQKIVISVQDKDGLKQFRVYVDEKFERLFRMYAEKVKLNLGSLVFCFDGDKVSPTATPISLGMEDDDIIEVHYKSRCRQFDVLAVSWLERRRCIGTRSLAMKMIRNLYS